MVLEFRVFGCGLEFVFLLKDFKKVIVVFVRKILWIDIIYEIGSGLIVYVE